MSGPLTSTRSPLFAHDVELEHVAVAHEAGDVQIGRLRIHLGRGPDLLHHAVLHHHDAIGQRQCLVLIVGDVDGGAIELAVDAPNLRPRLDAQLGVEIGQRLVHEDQRRLDDDGAGDGHALLLSAGKLSGQLMLLAGELHELERMRHARRAVRRGDAAHPQAEADVLGHAHVRKQGVILEHHAEAAFLGWQRVDALRIEPDASARQLHEPGDAIERGRLAAARWPEQADEFAAPDGQGQGVERVERLAAGGGKAARHAVKLQFVEIVFHRLSAMASPVSAAARPQREHAAQRGAGPFPRRARRAHFVFCAPTCWSQMRNASTCALGTSDWVCGNCASQPSYSGRPNSLIASWLSFGAIASVTSLTAGPG